MCMYVHVHVEAWSWHQCLSWLLATLSVEASLSWTRVGWFQLVQLASFPGNFLLYLPSDGTTGSCHTCLTFYLGSGDLNSGLWASCYLSTESSPWPSLNFQKKRNFLIYSIIVVCVCVCLSYLMISMSHLNNFHYFWDTILISNPGVIYCLLSVLW